MDVSFDQVIQMNNLTDCVDYCHNTLSRLPAVVTTLRSQHYNGIVLAEEEYYWDYNDECSTQSHIDRNINIVKPMLLTSESLSYIAYKWVEASLERTMSNDEHSSHTLLPLEKENILIHQCFPKMLHDKMKGKVLSAILQFPYMLTKSICQPLVIKQSFIMGPILGIDSICFVLPSKDETLITLPTNTESFSREIGIAVGGCVLKKVQLQSFLIHTRLILNQKLFYQIQKNQEDDTLISEVDTKKTLDSYFKALKESNFIKKIRHLKLMLETDISTSSITDYEFSVGIYEKLRSLHIPFMYNFSEISHKD